MRQIEGIGRRWTPYRAETCQFRVEKAQDCAHDVYCGQPVRAKHYFLCTEHYMQVIRGAGRYDRYRFARVPMPGLMGLLFRILRNHRGWYGAWVERPHWDYYYLLRHAYANDPYREFQDGGLR